MTEQVNYIYNKVSLWRINRMPEFGLIGACIYIAGFATPFKFKFDIPLFALALISILAAVSSFRNKSMTTLPLALSVFTFLISTGVSILVSEDISRSIRLSTSLLPAVLLYFLVAGHFGGIKDTRRLYLTFSVVVIALASGLLWAFFSNRDMGPFGWISNMGSPILIVKNDVTFLAVVSPLSLALLYHKSRSIYRVIAAISLLLCIAVIGIFQSRVAVLTLVASITCFFMLIRPKIGFACGSVILIMLLLVDGFMGFPLIERFIHHWDGTGRIPLWLSAWKMFLDAPLLGHGPHTFILFYNSYLNNLSLPSWLFVDLRVVPWAHNLYLEILAEHGIVGFIALSVLLFSGLLAAWKLRNASFSEARILGYGAFAALFGFCLASAAELTFLRQWVVIMMFTLIGVIAQLLSLESKERRKIDEKISS